MESKFSIICIRGRFAPLKYTLFPNFSFWPHAGRAVPFLPSGEEKELKDSFTHSFFQFAAISFTISGTRHLVISWPHFGSSFASLPCGSTSHDRAKNEKISLLVHIRACSIHIWKTCASLIFTFLISTSILTALTLIIKPIIVNFHVYLSVFLLNYISHLENCDN